MSKNEPDLDDDEPGIVTCFRCQTPAPTTVQAGITVWDEHKTPEGFRCDPLTGLAMRVMRSGHPLPYLVVGAHDTDQSQVMGQQMDFYNRHPGKALLRAALPKGDLQVLNPSVLHLERIADWAIDAFTRIEPDWFVPHFTIFAAMRRNGVKEPYVNNKPLEWWLANWDRLYTAGELTDDIEAFTEEASIVFHWADLRVLQLKEIVYGPDLHPLEEK